MSYGAMSSKTHISVVNFTPVWTEMWFYFGAWQLLGQIFGANHSR